jgi:hypothetical protein
MISGLFNKLGVLRCGHALIAVAVICAAPFADGTAHLHDWRIFPSVIAPSLMMMILFALALDITMSRVFMTDAPPPEQRRLGIVIKFDLALLAVMFLAWLPFMTKVLDFSVFG